MGLRVVVCRTFVERHWVHVVEWITCNWGCSFGKPECISYFLCTVIRESNLCGVSWWADEILTLYVLYRDDGWEQKAFLVAVNSEWATSQTSLHKSHKLTPGNATGNQVKYFHHAVSKISSSNFRLGRLSSVNGAVEAVSRRVFPSVWRQRQPEFAAWLLGYEAGTVFTVFRLLR